MTVDHRAVAFEVLDVLDGSGRSLQQTEQGRLADL
jgi:hypothetical protein